MGEETEEREQRRRSEPEEREEERQREPREVYDKTLAYSLQLLYLAITSDWLKVTRSTLMLCRESPSNGISHSFIYYSTICTLTM